MQAADGHVECVVDGAHPRRVPLREIVVYGDHVHPAARQAVEIGRQGGDEGLALPRTHLCDLAFVQDYPADQLDIEVAHAQGPTRRLSHRGKGLRKNVV